MKDESLLHQAIKDFKECLNNDPSNWKAKRAIEKINVKFKYFSPQRLTQKIGPWLIVLLSLVVFVLSQVSFFIGKPLSAKLSFLQGHPISIEKEYYVILTFGSLLFIVVGLYLPQIMKLKVGTFELEKSPVEQITSPPILGIGK